MSRDTYEFLIRVIDAEIAIYAECVQRCIHAEVLSLHTAKLALAKEAKHELSLFYFSRQPNRKVAINGPTEKPKCQNAQAA